MDLLLRENYEEKNNFYRNVKTEYTRKSIGTVDEVIKEICKIKNI